jgi:predicted metalloenzyme YecM
MTQLYKVSEQHRELQELVSDGEMTDEDLKDTFEGLEGQFNEKAVSLIQVVNNMESDTSEIDAEIDRLQARKKAINNKKDSLREYLRTNMEATGITSIKCPLFSITLANGRDIAVVDSEADVPDEMIEVSVVQKPNKAEILKKLKAGEHVPGCRMEKTKTSLRIK